VNGRLVSLGPILDACTTLTLPRASGADHSNLFSGASDRHSQEPAGSWATYTFRDSLLIRPFIIALALGSAGAVFSWLDVN